MYQEFLEGLSSLVVRIRMFQGQIAAMAELCFEPLTRRNSAAYADAYSRFYGQMASIAAHYFQEDFDQSFPVEVSFVPMMHPTEEGKAQQLLEQAGGKLQKTEFLLSSPY